MINELATVSLLQDAISEKLGSGFLVNMNALTSSLTQERKEVGNRYRDLDLDLVIWGPDRHRPFIVEFKALRKGVGVPLSTVPLLIELVDKNPGLQPHLIFATNGRVGSLVRRELQRRDIDVVESDSLSEMTSRIVEIVSRKSRSAQ